jgi:ubiquinone biosynthesis protein COQ9
MLIDDINNKRKILAKFLENAVFDGVDEKVLEKSMQECGFEVKFKDLIFEDGVLSLVDFQIEEIIQKLQENIQNQVDFSNFKIRDKIKFCLYDIFEQQKAHKDAIFRFREFYLSSKAPYGLKNALKFSDAIWSSIGDKSTDFNYYSKRLILAKIIARSFFVFVKNDFEETKSFIDQEIEKVMKFEKFKAKFKGFSCKNADFGEKMAEFSEKVKNPKDFIKNLPFIRLFN